MKIQGSKYKVQENFHCEERSDVAILDKIATRLRRSRWSLVLALFAIFLLLFPYYQVSAAVLYTGSATQVVYEGDTFVLDWFLDTKKIPLNTVDLSISFSKENLKAVDVSTGNSLLNLWIKQPTFNNDTGTIQLTGGAVNGFNSDNFPVFRTTFQATAVGNAKITVAAESILLRNDGRGTAEVIEFRPVEFPIVESKLRPGTVSSPTHPDQNAWYKNKTVKIDFERNSGIEYSYVFTFNPEVISDDTADQATGTLEFVNQQDGIYYFKLNSKSGAAPWQEAAVFRVQIDSTPPEGFPIEIGSDPNILSGREFMSFSTVDKTSGISHYKVKVGALGTWKIVESPYKLQKPIIGNEIKVLAVDKAGNERVQAFQYKTLVPIWAWITILGLIAMSAGWFAIRKFKQKI